MQNCLLMMQMQTLFITISILFFCMCCVSNYVLFNSIKFKHYHKSTINHALPAEVDILVVGAGLSGSIIAQQYAEHFPHLKILVIDKRSHIGGNCYDYVEADTGIRVNQYGIHLFHTNYDRVWNFINRFTEWTRWDHFTLGYVDDKFVPIPVGIRTVNMLFNLSIRDEQEMQAWLSTQTISPEHGVPMNSEEMSLSRVGRDLYEKIFLPYTVKQWDKHPTMLDPDVTARIPIRLNFDERYFTDKYQALPVRGFTSLFEGLLRHDGIEVLLNTDYLEPGGIAERVKVRRKIIYTGPIDAFFRDEQGLEYRSLSFERIVFRNVPGYVQPASHVNYPGLEYPFTRSIEYKWLLHQKSDHTVIFREYSSASGEPYYPVPNAINRGKYLRYQRKAMEMENGDKFVFVGRLANYKYFNMDEAVLNALRTADHIMVEEKGEVTYSRRYRYCEWIRSNVKNATELREFFRAAGRAQGANVAVVYRLSGRLRDEWHSDLWLATCALITESSAKADVYLHVVEAAAGKVPEEFRDLVVINDESDIKSENPHFSDGHLLGDIVMAYFIHRRSQYEFLWAMEDDCRYSGRWGDLLKDDYVKNGTDLVVWPGLLLDVERMKGFPSGWWHLPQYYHGDWAANVPELYGVTTMGFGFSKRFAAHLLSQFKRGTFNENQEVNLLTTGMLGGFNVQQELSTKREWEWRDDSQAQEIYTKWMEERRWSIHDNFLMHAVKFY